MPRRSRKPKADEDLERLKEPLWSAEELATFLDVPVSTIYHWRVKGEGPAGLRVGRHLRFAASDVARWLVATQTCRNAVLP